MSTDDHGKGLGCQEAETWRLMCRVAQAEGQKPPKIGEEVRGLLQDGVQSARALGQGSHPRERG